MPSSCVHISSTAAKADSAPSEIKEQVEDLMREGKTEIFDTHPSDAVRIEQVKKLSGPGIVNAEGTAGSLFRDFDATCREVTWSI